jgi:REP element-mobilizing transposase RayT
MPHSRYFLFYHIVFATKYREWFIDEGIEQAVWDILWEICIENGMKPYAIGGVDDHIHILVSIPATMAVADAVWKIKGASSRYITQRFPHLTDFRWQNGYAVLTFDYRALPRLVRYVRGQREHHSHRRQRQTPRALEPRA